MKRWKNVTAGLHERGDRHRGERPRDHPLRVERDLEHEHRDREADEDRERGPERDAHVRTPNFRTAVCGMVRALVRHRLVR